jgi:hypothetical protein
MQSLAGTIQAAAGPYPELHRKHNEVCKRPTRVRKALRDEAKEKKKRRRRRRRREVYYDIMPKIEVDKQVDQTRPEYVGRRRCR